MRKPSEISGNREAKRSEKEVAAEIKKLRVEIEGLIRDSTCGLTEELEEALSSRARRISEIKREYADGEDRRRADAAARRYWDKLAEGLDVKTIGGESVKMETEEKVKLTVEDIGTVIKNSGFKADTKVKAAAVDLLTSLSDFMTIEKKNGETGAETIHRLEREGILTPAAAKEALKKLTTVKTAVGGVKYDEDNRKSINFSKTAVNHVIRILNAL